MTFTESGGRPGDQRGFIHKKLLGFGAKLAGNLPIPGAKFLSGVAQRALGSTDRKRAITNIKFGSEGNVAISQFRPDGVSRLCPAGQTFNGQVCVPGLALGGGGRIPCDFPKVRDSEGRCRTPTSGEFGGEQFGVGQAVMGRYGAALEPGSIIVDRAVCLKGMQLGNDGLCYNKGAITNKQRQWPRGRRPLLTGGDMAAIGKASRAGARLDKTATRLRNMGMMKKLPSARKGPHQHAKASTAVVSIPR